MSQAFTQIDAAIEQVSKARQSVTRRKSKQVTAVDELDRLRSVAYAWFRSHRPKIASHASSPDLSDVDGAFKVVLGATGKRAARTTYGRALKDAKDALVELRNSVATAPEVRDASAEQQVVAPPSFALLAHDASMQAILDRRWYEIQACMTAEAFLAATVMMGGLLESLLIGRFNASSDQSQLYTASKAPKGKKTSKTIALQNWKLHDLIEVGHEVGWITKSAKEVSHVLRDFRNYIHPHKEYTDGITIGEQDAEIFWAVTRTIAQQVLESVGKTP